VLLGCLHVLPPIIGNSNQTEENFLTGSVENLAYRPWTTGTKVTAVIPFNFLSVTNQSIWSACGGSVILKMFTYSLREALKDSFPGINFFFLNDRPQLATLEIHNGCQRILERFIQSEELLRLDGQAAGIQTT